MFQQLMHWLNQPFPPPASANRHSWRMVGIGLFVTLFLGIVRPFGIANISEFALWIISLGFGIVTIVVSFIYEWMAYTLLGIDRQRPSWTYWKWLLATTLLILCIAAGNYAYLIYISPLTAQDLSFLEMLYSTFVVGIFPMIFLGALQMERLKKANQNLANSLQIEEPAEHISQALTLKGTNKNEALELLTAEFLYAEVQQNYVEIVLIKEGVQKELIRNTINGIEQQLNDTPIRRCHRSFLVNTNHIQKVEGNAQGLVLSLSHTAAQIPVSRKYVPQFRAS